MENYEIISKGSGVYTDANTGETFTLLQLVNKMIGLCNKILNLVPIDTDNVADLSITTQKLADASVTYEKIANGAISDVKIASQGVTTDNIRDYNITNDKIANDTITGFKIAEKTISGYHIGDGAITADKIANNTITPDKLKTDGQEEWPLYNVNSTKITTDTIFPKTDKVYVNGILNTQHDLEVDGQLDARGGISAESSTISNTVFKDIRCTNGIYFAKYDGSYQGPYVGAWKQTGSFKFFITDTAEDYSFAAPTSGFLFEKSQRQIFTLKQLDNVELDTGGHLKIGNTELTEERLIKLLALIPQS